MSEKLNSNGDNYGATEWDILKEGEGSKYDMAMKEMIEKEGEQYFNSLVNCGGFALEMFVCVFSGLDSLEKAVENITGKFPFVRVKGDTELEPDEYEVVYRHAEGGLGHHFVKKVGDKMLEKDGCQPVREFEEWGSLEDASEVVLAVNKNHEMRPRDEEGKLIYSYVV